jgi:hypothetical protein
MLGNYSVIHTVYFPLLDNLNLFSVIFCNKIHVHINLKLSEKEREDDGQKD